MAEESLLHDVQPATSSVVTAAQISQGNPIPPVSRLMMMSAEEWEVFTEEWATHLKNIGEYWRIRRWGGSGDRGLDVVAFTSELGFAAPWDSFQCKHYSAALGPNDVCIEATKVVYYSFKRTVPFNQSFRAPRRHVFVSPKGAGTTVQGWLADKERFREEFKNRWGQYCLRAIGVEVPLEGDLLAYVNEFDFGRFDDRSAVELVAQHMHTPYYAARFGGGLPPREKSAAPPTTPATNESVYIRKLLDAYQEHLAIPVTTSTELDGVPEIRNHYDRQRELFYSAEALRNFARDRTPDGTFLSFQEDVHDGVVDVYEKAYDTGLQRLRSTVGRAAEISVDGNALVSVARVRDKQGVCHQLANDCEFTWVWDAEAE